MNRPSDDKNCRVLIIEDNRQIHEEFRKILAPVPSVTAEKNALRSRGFEVDSAYQNQEGILLVEKAVAAGLPYAVVFVDVGVSPGWEGRETARRIWERDPRLQMVICTAGSDYSWKDGMSGKLGQHDGWLILRKPFDAVEARQLAQALTEKWRLHQLAREKMEALEGLVAARTSELQRSEAVLRESEQCFSGAFEHAPIGLALVSTEGRWLKVNRALCDLTGYSGEELLARSFKDITFPEDLGKDLEQMRRLIAGEIKFYQTEKRYVHRDGHLITVLLSVSIVRDEQGSPRYFVSQTMDITGRKQAEEQVRESQERYRSLIDTAGDAIFTIAPDGTFTSLNPAVEAMAGISRADWIGKSFAPMVHPEDLSLARQMFLRVMRGEPAPVHELRGNPGLARPARMEMTLTAQKDGAGKIIGVLGIGRDITERRRLEEKLFQSQKLETVGRLAGGIAHEFNSILTAIIGQSELLLGDLPSQGPLAKSANEIHQAANRAAALTRQLLAYGRKQILQPESLDLNRVIAGMDGVFQHLMGANVATRIIATPGLRMVKADAGQVEQVIMNLAMNARDAMPNGGQFILETGNVVIDPETVGRYPELKPGNYVMLAVTDTGCGMTAEVKARVFEPFFSTKNFGQATGLGLSTCYGIIKQSGGHISIYSEPSRGATFKVYLPQSEEATTAAPVRRLDAPELPRGTETILLVEDDPALREMAAILLRRLGYTILAAANGIEALSLKQQSGVGHIDLLFTDVVMPHMSGKELADRVRRLHPHTRILFTSAYTENAIVHQGMLTRGTALLSKPFTPMALANKLREVLDQAGGELPIGD